MLERFIRAMTRGPWLLAGISVVVAALSLQLDGALWQMDLRHNIVGQAAIMLNILVGIGAVTILCFALHGTWFRARHGETLGYLLPTPLPERPWDKPAGPLIPVASVYLRSVAICGAVVAATIGTLLALTPLAEAGGIISVAAALVSVLAGIGHFWARAKVKAAAAKPAL